jgi:hypothetical protein
MLTVTIDIKGMKDYRESDRIRVMADAINTVEEWLYAVAGDATLDVNRMDDREYRRVIGTVDGTFDSLVSPYMFEVLDNNVGELKRIWTCDIDCTITGA